MWQRTDQPVRDGEVERSWLWGPEANIEVFEEPYLEAAGGMREVQYGDKSRMEMPVPGSNAAAEDDASPWAITQGLLATEFMTGRLQVGDNSFLPFPPDEIPVEGDRENNPGPTCADVSQHIEREARPGGGIITETLDASGGIVSDNQFEQYSVTDEYYIEQTDHNSASVFWDFMQSQGLVYVDDELTTGPLFLNELYAIGYPVTEGYWSKSLLQGEVQDILIQCFERRCLTFAPDNEAEWQVESGNVGLHYHEWRYNIIGDPVVSISFDPVNAVNTVGTEYKLTATLMENGTDVTVDSLTDGDVTIDRVYDTDANLLNGPGVGVGESETLEDGAVVISYTGPTEPRQDDTLTATSGTLPSSSLTKHWVAGDAHEVWLSHSEGDFKTGDAPDGFFEDRSVVGVDHTVYARIVDEFGNTVDHYAGSMTFTVEDDSTTPTGHYPDGQDGVENVTDGEASFTYSSSDVRVDTIGAFLTDDTSVAERDELTRTWVEQVGSESSYAGGVTNRSEGSLNLPWLETSNAVGQGDSSVSTAGVISTYATDILVLSNFHFDIPEGATILGIEVKVWRSASSTQVSDRMIQLTKNRTSGVGNKCFLANVDRLTHLWRRRFALEHSFGLDPCRNQHKHLRPADPGKNLCNSPICRSRCRSDHRSLRELDLREDLHLTGTFRFVSITEETPPDI